MSFGFAPGRSPAPQFTSNWINRNCCLFLYLAPCMVHWQVHCTYTFAHGWGWFVELFAAGQPSEYSIHRGWSASVHAWVMLIKHEYTRIFAEHLRHLISFDHVQSCYWHQVFLHVYVSLMEYSVVPVLIWCVFFGALSSKNWCPSCFHHPGTLWCISINSTARTCWNNGGIHLNIWHGSCHRWLRRSYWRNANKCWSEFKRKDWRHQCWDKDWGVMLGHQSEETRRIGFRVLFRDSFWREHTTPMLFSGLGTGLWNLNMIFWRFKLTKYEPPFVTEMMFLCKLHHDWRWSEPAGGCQVTTVHFNCVLSACARTRDWPSALAILEDMNQLQVPRQMVWCLTKG